MPAAAVIPTLKVYVKVVAVKTLVVGFKWRKPAKVLFGGLLRRTLLLIVTLNKI